MLYCWQEYTGMWFWDPWEMEKLEYLLFMMWMDVI